MFTLLEKIANLLLVFTKSHLEHQDRTLRRVFGESILTCYLRLLEVISTGELILDQLEYLLGSYQRDRLRLPDDYWEHRALYLEKPFLHASDKFEQIGGCDVRDSI